MCRSMRLASRWRGRDPRETFVAPSFCPESKRFQIGFPHQGWQLLRSDLRSAILWLLYNPR